MARAMAASMDGVTRKKPSAVRSPVQKAWSRGSTSLVRRLAPSESVRATTREGTPATSAARRAATRVWMCCGVGMRTLPPMCPHFLAEDS